ncbi:MAG TPA: methyltransferase domain-containing protein [Gaiellaceae bacterium]|nr:methyltransferase domain-containing protein [Gaiellaceae bacterium]
MVEQTPDLQAVTESQRSIWGKGDFARVAPVVQIVAERLVDAVDPLPGDRVLDVACGSGNAAIAAARAYTHVTGLDFVAGPLERARLRAEAEFLPLELVVGDAQALPFPDASFDVAVSVFGVMFAPDQERAAAELLRVVRPGGRIGLANWLPTGFVAEIFQATTRFLPPPPGLTPPVAWGTEERLRELFGDGISELSTERRVCTQRFLSPEHWLDVFRRYFGPTVSAFERLEPERHDEFGETMLEIVRRHNRAGERAAVIESEYLEVVATRA